MPNVLHRSFNFYKVISSYTIYIYTHTYDVFILFYYYFSQYSGCQTTTKPCLTIETDLFLFFPVLFLFWSETGFRNQMLNVIRQFSQSHQNGLFINSCFAHCQPERQDTWFADNSPVLHNKVKLMPCLMFSFR